IEVTPEYTVSGGRLDFLFTGLLADNQRVYACVEFKHAHSRDLLHGLTHQLPAYMRGKGCDFGLYCVLYFRGGDFAAPAQYSADALQLHLVNSAEAAGIFNVDICSATLRLGTWGK